jgi:REP element-mobilizing transposase RayT
MTSKQADFFDQDPATKKRYARTTYGGDTQGQRKLERPLAAKKWIHLTLKSDLAVGPLNFLNPRHRIRIEKLLFDRAKQFGVAIAELVTMSNHFHVRVRMSSRSQFKKFLKTVTGLIARMVTGARRGHKFGRFWTGLAYTRVLKSSFELLQLKGYFEANRKQAQHGYQAREEFRESFNIWVQRMRYGEFEEDC